MTNNELNRSSDRLNHVQEAGETLGSVNLVDLSLADARQKNQDKISKPPQPGSAHPLGSKLESTPVTQGESKSCPPSLEFQSYVDRITEQMYNPGALGDLNALRNKYNCEIANGGSPFDYAKKVFEEDDDPYTAILSPEQFKKMIELQKGHDVGAGVVLRMPTATEETGSQPQKIIVQEFEATPGRKEQLKPGDEILAIDNQSMTGKSWRDALKFFDGKENTEVDVKILRDGTEQTVRLKRTNEELPAATSQLVDNGKFAHIRLRTFMQDDTSAELEREIKAHPNAEGYILDLRHNPGGLLDQAFTSASVFISQGDVLNIRQRERSNPANPQFKEVTYRVTPTNIEKVQDGKAVGYMARHQDQVHKPVVVLTDQGTASAAEILTGALQDTDGAYVIGTPTYGKGIGQTIISDWLSGGAIKMTTFNYFTPKGNWPGDAHHNRMGLKPDLYVPNPAPQYYGTAQDGQLNAAIQFLRNKTAIDNPKPFRQ